MVVSLSILCYLLITKYNFECKILLVISIFTLLSRHLVSYILRLSCFVPYTHKHAHSCTTHHFPLTLKHRGNGAMGKCELEYPERTHAVQGEHEHSTKRSHLFTWDLGPPHHITPPHLWFTLLNHHFMSILVFLLLKV